MVKVVQVVEILIALHTALSRSDLEILVLINRTLAKISRWKVGVHLITEHCVYASYATSCTSYAEY